MSEPMAVLHLIDCLNIGGTERQMLELLRRTDRARYRPLLACFKRGGHLQSALQEIGVEPIEVPLKGALFQPNTIFQIRRLARICEEQNVRVLHAHDFYANVIAVALGKWAKIPVIVSRRDLGHWLSPAKQKMLRFACHFADRVLANAEAVGERYLTVEGGDREKLCVIPNGIDIARFDELGLELPSMAGDTTSDRKKSFPRIITVASMNLRDKGHSDLIEAAKSLRDHDVNFEWWLVGDGSLRPELEQRARTESLNLRFLGRRTDVPRLLKHSDLLVHPSWAEGFPNAILEGMCASLPVVATRVGGVPELVRDGETGFLVEPKQPMQIVSAIERLLADRANAVAMGAQGRRAIEAHYTLDRMASSVEQLYDALSGAAKESEVLLDCPQPSAE